ncbi:MAG TPA: 50S ribosomal protein L25 [Coriobacteriia bacterium]|nr:50S ribosomal protein L25 [Coriobacteriia bacterium]
MTDTMELKAETRTRIGKSSRALERQGKLPAVVYGVGVPSKAISIDRHEFEQIAGRGTFGSALFKLSVDGHKPLTVMVKDVRHEPIRGTIEHVDFWAIKMTQLVSTDVPIEYVGDSAGEKSGGVMLHELRQIHIEALPADLPENIQVDVSALEVGQSIHVRDLAASEGVTILDEPETIVCSVITPTVEVEEEEAVEAAPVEPELIGEVEDSEG